MTPKFITIVAVGTGGSHERPGKAALYGLTAEGEVYMWLWNHGATLRDAGKSGWLKLEGEVKP